MKNTRKTPVRLGMEQGNYERIMAIYIGGGIWFR